MKLRLRLGEIERYCVGLGGIEIGWDLSLGGIDGYWVGFRMGGLRLGGIEIG